MSGEQLLDRLSEDFLARHRAGECPTVGEYIERHPELADEIRELFAMLLTMEDLASDDGLPSLVPEQLGEYRILREVGRGGMGVVYEAEQVSLGRHVALKVLPFHTRTSATVIDRFQREAQAAARLHHSNIVPVFGVGEHEGVHYYAMQFLHGQPLDDVITELKRLGRKKHSTSSIRLPGATESDTEREYFQSIARVGIQVADALAYAHGQGVLHRDIKPSNLLLDANGTVWVTDFGLAQAEGTDSLTQTGDIVGTLAYMAPERFEGWSDARTDVHGLGLVLYELLALQPAFDEPDARMLLAQVMDGDTRPLRSHSSTIPRDLETIVMKCLAREPAYRYSHASDLANDLRRFIEGEPIRARRSTAWEKGIKWARRHKAVASLSFSLLVLLVLSTIGASMAAVWLRVERDEARTQLWNASLARARAERISGVVGHRFNSLESIALAATIRQGVKLRNEAIACIALTDVASIRSWRQTGARPLFACDLRSGRYAAANGWNGEVRIGRMDGTGEPLRLASFGRVVFNLVIGPDPRYLGVRIEGSAELDRISVWDLERLRPVFHAPVAKAGTPFLFSRDGSEILIRSDESTWRSVETGASRPATGVPEARHYAWHPTDALIGACQHDRITIWDLERNEARRVLDAPERPIWIAWHPDGTLLAAGCHDHHIHVWNTHSGAKWTVLRAHGAPVVRLGFNSEGLLASGAWDNTTILWNAHTGDRLVQLPGEFRGFLDDRHFLSRSGNLRELQRVTPPTPFRVLSHAGVKSRYANVTISADGCLMACKDVSTLLFWDLRQGRLLASRTIERGSSLAFLEGGKSVYVIGPIGSAEWPIVRDGSDVRLGSVHAEVWPGPLAREGHPWLSRDGRTASMARHDGVRIYDRSLTRLLGKTGRHAGAKSAKLSPDSRWAVTTTWKGSNIRVWDAKTGELVREFPSGNALAYFSPDGRLLVTSTGEEYAFIEVGTWIRKYRVARSGAGNLAGQVAFTADSRIAALAITRTDVRLVDVTTGSEIATLVAPNPQEIASLDFAPDGSTIVAGTFGAQTQVWDLRALRAELARLGLDW